MSNSAIKRNDRYMPSGCVPFRFLAWVIVGLVFIALMPSQGFSANFNVSPTSLELTGGAKSGTFSVINSGEDKLTCQIDLKEWSQDADGKDAYTDAKDIVFFPKIMTVEPNEQRAVRIGIKGPLSAKEKTYRLFVEEIPSQKKATDQKDAGKITAGLTIAFRYSMPIFMRPARPQESGIIEKIDMSEGVVKAVVRNTGNVHFKLLSVTFHGKAAGTGCSRRLRAGMSCMAPRVLMKRPFRKMFATNSQNRGQGPTENFEINGNTHVLKTMCLP
jgi:fimbrial chaperone protein